MTKKTIKPIIWVLLKKLLDDLKLSQYRLAKDLGINAMRINFAVNQLEMDYECQACPKIGKIF